MEEPDKTVLFVDDEESLVDAYSMYLDGHYNTKTATGGREALTKLNSDVDVLVIDRRMPEVTGDEVIRRLDEWSLEFRIIIVSAVDPDTDIIDLPIDGYITKTVSEEELLDAVERALLKDRCETLVAEYNSVSESYDILNANYSRTELDEKDRVSELEDRMEAIEDELESVVDDLGESSITKIFN
jgi:CheY-like chemotaxis protein